MRAAINLLKMEAESRRGMSIPNSQTITEYTANQNKKLADEYEFAAECLKRIANEGFIDGWLQGIKNLAESMKAKRDVEAK